MLRVRLQRMNLFFDRKFDLDRPEHTYDLKLGFESSHTLAIRAARPGGHVLDIGCGQGLVARELVRKGCRVTGMDRFIPESSNSPNELEFIRWDLDRREFPVHVSRYDQIFLLDIIEHLRTPEEFMEELRFATGRKRPEVILTTANIGFFTTRLMLLFGQFNYGKKGILDVTHTRLFTSRSLLELLRQSDYEILEVRGIPVPFSKALGDNFVARLLVRLNAGLIRLSRGLFSYQIFVRAQARPGVHHLMLETVDATAELRTSGMASLVLP